MSERAYHTSVFAVKCDEPSNQFVLSCKSWSSSVRLTRKVGRKGNRMNQESNKNEAPVFTIAGTESSHMRTYRVTLDDVHVATVTTPTFSVVGCELVSRGFADGRYALDDGDVCVFVNVRGQRSGYSAMPSKGRDATRRLEAAQTFTERALDAAKAAGRSNHVDKISKALALLEECNAYARRSKATADDAALAVALAHRYVAKLSADELAVVDTTAGRLAATHALQSDLAYRSKHSDTFGDVEEPRFDAIFAVYWSNVSVSGVSL